VPTSSRRRPKSAAPATKRAAKRPPRRRTPRVTGDGEPTRQIRESVIHKQHEKGVTATAKLVDGEVLIQGQVSETVPVAQYANVVILSGLQWKCGGIDMEALIDVNWGGIDQDEESDSYGESTFDYEAMTPKQRAAYDRVRGACRATMKVIEHGNAEDRETVEISVRMHNEREAAEAEAEEKAAKAQKAKRRASTR